MKLQLLALVALMTFGPQLSQADSCDGRDFGDACIYYTVVKTYLGRLSMSLLLKLNRAMHLLPQLRENVKSVLYALASRTESTTC